MLIGEVGLSTNDVNRLADFYRTLLRLPKGDGDPLHQVLISQGTALTVERSGRPLDGRNDRICLAFTVDDVDAEYRRLKDMGVEIVTPPADRPWGARNMSFRDPDGNTVYFRTIPGK